MDSSARGIWSGFRIIIVGRPSSLVQVVVVEFWGLTMEGMGTGREKQ